MQVSEETLSLGRRASIRTMTSNPQNRNDHNSPHTPSPHPQQKNYHHQMPTQYTSNIVLDGKTHDDDIDHEIISVTEKGLIGSNLRSSPKSKIPRPPSSIANNASASLSTSSSLLNYEINTRRCVSSMGNLLMMEPVTPKKKKSTGGTNSSSKKGHRSTTSFSSSVSSISSRSSSESRKLRPRYFFYY